MLSNSLHALKIKKRILTLFHKKNIFIMKGKITTVVFCSLVLLLAISATSGIYAQSGIYADRVYPLIQSKCAATCHNYSNPTGNLDLTGSAADVYAKIVGISPDNAAAQSKGYKLVYPGHPYRSFMLLKANNGLIHAYDGGQLTAEEGTYMPPYGGGSQPLTNIELEMVRQWIYAGAPLNEGGSGYVVDQQLIIDYYNDGGLPLLDRPAPPTEGHGFQIHLGPLFLAPSQEVEYDIKYELNFPADFEVNRLNLKMNDESHHFILYKFNDESSANSVSQGLRPINIVSTALDPDNNEFVAGWQNDVDIRLPAGTAFRWAGNTILNLNYHVPNYSAGLILPTDMYLNVHTQPYGTAIQEMKSDLVQYDANTLWPPSVGIVFTLPPGEWTLTDNWDTGPQINLWMLTSHTHKFGTDYDLYQKTPSGGKGEKIFEGFMDYTYCNCDLGYYDWEHPPVKYYEPFYTIPAGTGLVQEAKFNNTSDSWVTFGLTTNDEMMLFMAQYTEGEPIPFVGITNIADGYCVTADAPALNLIPEGGVLDGPGVVDGQFVPSAAGVGEHEIHYTAEGLTATYTITVYPAPEAPEISLSAGLLGTTAGYDNYQWYFEGNLLTGATGIFYTPQAPGNYTVEVMLNGCTVMSEPFLFEPVGIDNPAGNGTQVYVFPNPYQNRVNITYIVSQKAPVKVVIYDAVGKPVQTLVQTEQSPAQYTYQFSAKEMGLPAGIYFVQVTIDGKTAVHKIMEQ
ncbi:T9SS C-terminal target domain-containing protein [Sphingobacteriales bacterium UPWRP_1]|nr:hypothetical protein B6N25_16710 [Sphingobacteriales bacterium TSM_CSS]PSJ73569.1 T9SS C-terminal target domain-containing protein [Sphingobacteriales bacterium UPWRP_1]